MSTPENVLAENVLTVPDLSLVALVGASASGKSSFARRHFGQYETLSSDLMRGMVSDDETSQAATKDAFEVLDMIAGKRLTAGRLTVVDATNVQRESRRHLLQLARDHDVLPVAIVFDLPEKLLQERNLARNDRVLPARVIGRHVGELRRSLRGLAREGFRTVHVLSSQQEIDAVRIVREPLRSDLRGEHGPFDAVGDVHGCLTELVELLDRLGYAVIRDGQGRPVDAVHPQGRRVILLGDLVDRGPDVVGVLRLAMGMHRAGHALVVPGNHEHKLVRALRGKDVQRTHGLPETLDQLERADPEFVAEVARWCDGLVAHLVLDGGKLVVAHAGLKESYHNRASGRVRSFALYGDSTGETDEYGLPVRYPWAQDYRGSAMVLYGHVPTLTPEWVNNTMCLDTGCVFGGRLTALRYPEKELASVAAQQVWYEPARPLGPAAPTVVRDPDAMDLAEVLGARTVETALHGRVSVRADSAAGALEVMSRFAMPPRWLPYLPPTMSPVATAAQPDLLEHPEEAWAAYRSAGVQQVIAQEKHMGSRAVVVLCRDTAVAATRFGATDGETGAVYTRTGRAFFDRPTTEALLAGLRFAVDAAGLWDELATGWVILDAELLPWSAKAVDLLRAQFAPVGAAGLAVLPAAVAGLEAAAATGVDVTDLLARTRSRLVNAEGFVAAYRRYCWPVDGLDGVALAPFQVLAAEGFVGRDRDHLWHLAIADRLVAAAPELVRSTRRCLVDVEDEGSRQAGTAWWTELTAAGGEGMVVKPVGVVRGPKGLLQPGLKVRGREYLRIVYGPDYTEPANLTRLRERHLGHKRSLALREYALGQESLDRFVAGEPLWRVHEAVFAVLALESEPVDPRL